MIIRQETPRDYDEVYNLVKIAFASNPNDDGTVPDYLNELRRKDAFIPELSLITEIYGTIVGQVVLYKTTIATVQGTELTELLLSPISVHPDHFRRGIASAMIGEALQIAVQLSYRAVFLCGDPKIYGKLGFAPTYKYSIFHKKDNAAEWSMMRELYTGALGGITGTINTI